MKATLSYPISFCSVIVHRTQSNQIAFAIQSDRVRCPIRLRSPSDDLNAKCTNTYQGVHLSQVYQQNMRCTSCYISTATTLVHLRQVHPLKDYCM